MKIYAYYFPNWHVDKFNEKSHGTGWTEWRVSQYAIPRFEGHDQPKVPLWGYGDEADPQVMEQKIKACKEYGVDGFIFCWYWVDGNPYREKCLEEGFLKTSNTNDAEFSIMYCNHNPIQAHPSPRAPIAHRLGNGGVDPEGFAKMTDYCIEHYFGRENYTRVDGKLLFNIFNLEQFIIQMGSLEAAVQGIKDFRERVRKAGLGEIHFTSIYNYNRVDAIVSLCCGYSNINEIAKALTLDSWSTHGMPGMEQAKGFPTAEFSVWAEQFTDFYEEYTPKLDIPLSPGVNCGWDTSPRTLPSDIFENVGYPFCRVMVGNTPEVFKKLLIKAKNFLDGDKCTGKYLTVHSWNEWTEGAFLEPDKTNKYGFLEAIKDVFKSREV